MQAGACQADEGAEFGRGPLRGWGGTVNAGCVSGAFLQGCELQGYRSEGIDLVGGERGTLVLVSGSTSHILLDFVCANGWADCLLPKFH